LSANQARQVSLLPEAFGDSVAEELEKRLFGGMTDANLRVFGERAPMIFRKFAGANRGGLAVAAGLSVLVMAGCASSPVHLGSPACDTMRVQIKEKQKLDAEVKALGREVRDLQKQGDTTAAVAAQRQLDGLIESQRFLKDALDQSSHDCSPILRDSEPPLDPALRERQRLEGK
jgi:hypothetical protein